MNRRFFHLAFLSAGALVAGLLLVQPIAAAQKKALTPFAVQVAELQRIKLLLEHADHDYKGHRAAAVKELTAAIHQLHPGHAHQGHTGKGVKGGREAQPLSDAQLKKAMADLMVVQRQIAGAAGAAPARASAAIGRALGELNIALQIK